MPILTLQPNEASSKDSYIGGVGAIANNNFGVATVIPVGRESQFFKGLLQFDLSPISSSAIIVSATLTLWCSQESNSGNHVIGVHRSLVDWFEGEKNNAVPDAMQDGSTWNHRNANGSVEWAQAGGESGTDYTGTATDTTAITSDNAFFSWDVTEDVEDFVDGTATNRGWWLVTVEDVSANRKIFDSSGSATEARRPKLVIDYINFDMEATITGSSSVVANLSASLQSLEIQPDGNSGQDTHIREFAPASNFGTGTLFSTGVSSAVNASRRRMLLRFDLSDIPNDAIISKATLEIFNTAILGGSSPAVSIHRSLVEWYEGLGGDAGSTPGAGVNASTWNFRNHNGSIAWEGGAGGAAGDDWETTATDSVNVTTSSQWYEWDVTIDIQDFVSGNENNYGWWLINGESAGTVVQKSFSTSDETINPQNRPKLTLLYYTNSIAVNISGSSSLSVSMTLGASLDVVIEGGSSVFAEIHSNQEISAVLAGESSFEADIIGGANIESVIDTESDVQAHILGRIALAPALIESNSTVVGHLVGAYNLGTSIQGSSVVNSILVGVVYAQVTIESSTFVHVAGWARATGKVSPLACFPQPLLYITDGSIKSNGQLNIIDFISPTVGYCLKEGGWRPQISQYKEGGRFSSSPQANGRRLRSRVFDNAIEVFNLEAKAQNQDALIFFQKELISFQEAAADYWASTYTVLPYYIVQRAALETNTRYAIIYMISIPELENPYSQMFFDDNIAAFNSLTVRVERGQWASMPPGQFEPIAISSQRSWTVNQWQTGS